MITELKLEKLNNEYVRDQYNNGQLTDKDINSIFCYLTKNPGELNLFGMTLKDLKLEQRCSNIPGVRKFYKNAINNWYRKETLSAEQNKESLTKLMI